ncbi:amino acid adenylation domain-containing protein [Streptomyces sp. p1417]|uniref:Amino acid adenylation domain-containing protein n=1 Tax=Streptomyces typhae TaxID=2681492 RepID=A0A6L6X4M7_9ACTN|nr:non-ribosomal peptide synthetase [Streptomyces typhae]MVO88580.1 amino acid adenylation domain-containing protein [Streptomyces typhae]
MSHPTRLPLTAYQRDIWAASALDESHPQFNCVVHERLTGRIDVPALRASLARAVRRHDAFSLSFDADDDVPYQWQDPEVGAAPDNALVTLADLSDEADPRAACAQWVERALARPFPLRRSRMFDIRLLREGPGAVHLVVRAHHIVTDGYGIFHFTEQVFEDYARVKAGAEPLAGTAPSYADFVAEEARYTASPQFRQDQDFHRRALGDVEPALFTRATGPAADGPATGRYSFTVDSSLVRRLREQERLVFPVVAAAFATYLGRVHRAREVVIGIPMLNRRSGEELATVGHFANILPLRLPTDGSVTMRRLGAAVESGSEDLRRHERLALGDVLRALPRDSGGAPRLFDVTLSYLPMPPGPTVAGLTRETRGAAPAHAQDAVAVHVLHTRGTDDVRITLVHARDVCDEDFPVRALADHVTALIRGAVEEPDRPIGSLPMLGAAERRKLEAAARGPRVSHPELRTLHSLFEEQAARTPDRRAVLAGTTSGGPGGGASGVGSLTFGALDAAADRVAHALRAAGVGADDRVAVLLERGPLTPVAVLGVLKAGAAYVPVDPGHPPARIAFVLRDSRAEAVLVGPGSPVVDGMGPAEVLRVDELLRSEEAPHAPAAVPPESCATSRDLAYVIYTSGSTGTPKGVMVEHRSVVNRLAWMQRAYPIGADDVILHKTPIAFDVSVWELFWWAVEGAAVAPAPVGAEKDPAALARTVAGHGVTVAHFVPSMLGPFLDLLEESPQARAEVRSLRYVFCSGEALPPAHVDRFNRIFGADGAERPAPKLVNLYGPTEATVDVSWYDCPADPGRPVRRVPIGRPIDNTDLYVLGAHEDEPQPFGVPGELCVAGVGVARGYLNRPELTREKFTARPSVPGGRLYRTGDLARVLADGTIEYLGRIDGQVKIRGNRIELGEVEHHLSTAPGVRGAVVDSTTSALGTRLVGYYLADEPVDDAALRAHLARGLPDFMIPAYLVRVDHIPLTPNGKTDRRALPAPDIAHGASGGPSAPPRDATEATLVSVWSEVLGQREVGIHDDYYALGGDSLLTIRIQARAARLGVHFAPNDLVQHPTVAALAVHCTGGPREPAPDLAPFALVPEEIRDSLLRSGNVEDAFPLTRLQLGLIYHSDAQEGSAVYHDVFHYSFRLPWAEDSFRSAFDQLVARHPALRSSLDLGGHAEPLQVVHRQVTGGLTVVDQRGMPRADADAAVDAYIEQQRHLCYDLSAAPLCHFRVHVRADTVELVLGFHHALLDGGSVASLLRELLDGHLRGLGENTDPAPTDVPPSPAHHVRAERAALESPDDRRHWKERLDGARGAQLDGFRSAAPVTGPAGFVTHRAALPDGVEHRLRAFSRAHAVPVKSVLFAAHCLTLRLFSGQHDLTTGLLTHGRPERADGDRTAGLFVNTIPVRMNDTAGTWLAVVREAHREERRSHPHRRYPLSAIQEDSPRGPVVRTAFNYVNFHILAPVLDHPSVALLSLRTFEETDFQLLVNAVTDPGDGGLWLRIDGDGRTFTAEQAELVGRAYTAILTRLLDRPEEPADLGFLATTGPLAAPPAVRVAAAPEAPADVVRLFARQAARTPDAVALVQGTRRWTYRELDRAAERIAGRLLGLGAGPGARVGIAMDRAPETVAVILAVARAGAACVPLDTGYPAERIASMLDQARPVLVVAHRDHAPLVGGPAEVALAEDLLAQDDRETAGAETAERAEAPGPDPDSTAYILFTSGSTGRPKGVVMPHRSLAALVAWQNRRPSGAVGGTTVSYAPLSFDVSFQETFSTLCSGGTLVLATEAERRDMPALLRLIDRHGVERIFLPYVALQQFAEAACALGPVPRRLRTLVSSGEQLRVSEEIRRLCALLPGVVLENQYGPTETHVVTSFTMSGDPAAFPPLPPVGTPVDGAEVHVLDAGMRPVPDGVKGEIHLGGSCLADGYTGAPELTAERFVPHPAGGGRRLYRTGDLGYRLPGGDIVYAGRADSQVKIRGFRVEPAEVELAVARLAAPSTGVREVAVVDRRRGTDSFLAAFLVGDGTPADLGALRDRLRAALPEHLVPSHIQWLPGMPLTPSGKRDDAALRRTELTTASPRTGVAARDPYERTLVEVFAELLGVPAPGVHDNLFELGGTSITAMHLVMLVEQRLGVRLPLSALVAAPTPAAIAERLRPAAAAPDSRDVLVPFRRDGGRPPVFFVHPLGGNVLCYLTLARHLPADQPFYGIQAAGFDPDTEPHRSIPEMAAAYVEAVRRVRPDGPYVIGGWSFGGFVAFEMTRLLRRAGQEVLPPILLDTVALSPDAPRNVTDTSLFHFFFWELLWADGGSEIRVEELSREIGSEEEVFRRAAEIAERNGILPPGDSHDAVRRLYDVFRANYEALMNESGEVDDQDLVLLHAQGALPDVLKPLHEGAGSLHGDPTNGWRTRTTGAIEVVDVPGDHLQVVEEPYVKYVAEQITRLVPATPPNTGHGPRGER